MRTVKRLQAMMDCQPASQHEDLAFALVVSVTNSAATTQKVL